VGYAPAPKKEWGNPPLRDRRRHDHRSSRQKRTISAQHRRWLESAPICVEGAVAAGERVLDVPKLAFRVWLLQAGDINKNDPNDALPVAVAALRSTTARLVTAEDYPGGAEASSFSA
jgi:hypothetical protein